MSKKEDKINSLQEEFNRIQEEHKDLDVSQYLANREEDLPDLGEIPIYDYNTDIEESKKVAKDVLESMVDLYLGDTPSVKSHKYIIKKMEEDAQVYADTILLQNLAKKNLLTQLRQVDSGDTSARMHEVVNDSFSQIRENIKFSQSQRIEFEKYWKEMRRDMGLNEISESMEQKNIDTSEQKPDGKILDSRSLNDLVDKMLKGDLKKD